MWDALDVAGVRAWLVAATDLVAAHRDELDALNVYPVADHDTGSNVLATLRSASAGESVALAARGNSGLILAEWLRGVLPDAGSTLTADALRVGLREGADRARQAVAHPVEGTALSVADSAATAHGETLAEVAAAASDAAGAALLATRDQLPELRRAGVVDAGGRAVCLVLDALVATVTGKPADPLPVEVGVPAGPEPERMHYEVQYAIETAEIAALRGTLAGLGDSVVTAELGPGDWRVHVHLADAGAAIEAGLALGRPRHIRIEALPAAAATRAVLAVGLDPAVATLLAGEGVLLPESDPDRILAAAGRAPAVLILDAGGQGGAALAVAELRGHGVQAAALPLRSSVQALAAVAVHDPEAEFADAVVAMAEAAAATRYGHLEIAAAAAQTSAGPCRVGDVLGFAEDDVVLIGSDADVVASGLLDRLLATSGELVTLIGGGLAERLRLHLAVAHPTVEVQAHPGPEPGLWIGVE